MNLSTYIYLIYIYIYISIYLSVCLSIYLCIYLSIHPPIHESSIYTYHRNTQPILNLEGFVWSTTIYFKWLAVSPWSILELGNAESDLTGALWMLRNTAHWFWRAKLVLTLAYFPVCKIELIMFWFASTWVCLTVLFQVISPLTYY